MKIRLILGLAAASLLAFRTQSFADSFFSGPPTISAGVNGETAPTTATDYDYDTFGATPVGVGMTPVKSLTNFAVNLVGPPADVIPLRDADLGGGAFNAADTPTIVSPSVPTFPFKTGVAIDNNGTSGQVEIATFSPNKAGSFTVEILDNNATEQGGKPLFANSGVALGIPAAGLNPPVIMQTTGLVWDGNNQYVTYSVMNANANQEFDVFATGTADEVADNNGASIGGLIFNFTAAAPSADVPEPSSVVALLGLGAMGLFFAARSRMSKAA